MSLEAAEQTLASKRQRVRDLHVELAEARVDVEAAQSEVRRARAAKTEQLDLLEAAHG